jgi:hypothetical protein
MKNAGADIVSRVAVDKLMDWLEEYSKALTTCALDIAKNSNRKKLTYGDMKIAIKLIGIDVSGISVLRGTRSRKSKSQEVVKKPAAKKKPAKKPAAKKKPAKKTPAKKKSKSGNIEQTIVEIKDLMEKENYSQAKSEIFKATENVKELELTNVLDELKELREEAVTKEKVQTQEIFDDYAKTQTLKDIIEIVDDSSRFSDIKNDALKIEERIQATEDADKREKLESLQTHGYSVRNYLLVLAQARKRNDKNFVGVLSSFGGWMMLGARVSKNPDESKPYSYKIMVPVFKKKKGGGSPLDSFKIGSVFDISQTNKYEDYLAVKKNAQAALEYKDEIPYKTADSFVKKNFPDITIDDKEKSSHGLFNQLGYSIIESKELKTTGKDAKTKNDILAEVAAYLLMKRFEGEYKINYNFGYSNVWALKILDVFQFREFEKSYNSLVKYVKGLKI